MANEAKKLQSATLTEKGQDVDRDAKLRALFKYVSISELYVAKCTYLFVARAMRRATNSSSTCSTYGFLQATLVTPISMMASWASLGQCFVPVGDTDTDFLS